MNDTGEQTRRAQTDADRLIDREMPHQIAAVSVGIKSAKWMGGQKARWKAERPYIHKENAFPILTWKCLRIGATAKTETAPHSRVRYRERHHHCMRAGTWMVK